MTRILVVATAGAGGDLQPLVAVATALQGRGHEIALLGDAGVAAAVAGLPIAAEVLPPTYDLGPRMVAAIREAMAANDGRIELGGDIVQRRLGDWAQEVAEPIATAIGRHHPSVVITSLFGVEPVAAAKPACPWVVVNSTFYIGPGSPRPIEADVHARAVPLLARYAALLDAPDLVLHATDAVFDFSFAGLPPRHHYVGPLAVWERPSEPPAWLDHPGPPWVLVSISSQVQDDAPLVGSALAALADREVRVVATVSDHADEPVTVPANARVERFAPHGIVLDHARLLVSHAGHGTVMKALWHGCPMVLVPWGRDQPGVAARARALTVAEVVPRGDASPESLARAVDRALTDPAIAAAARSHARRLQATDPRRAALALVEPLL